jgi:hypothetical protein
VKPADQRIAEAMRLLREIATHHDMEFASLVVRGDGRGEIEVSDSRRGFKRVVVLDMDIETGTVGELPLYAYPRDRSGP